MENSRHNKRIENMKHDVHLLSVRIDDVCPYMNWDNFEKTLEVLLEKGVKPLLGVVPDCRDKRIETDKEKANFWEKIADLKSKGYVIAMHGYQHIYETSSAGIFPLNGFSEFAGLSYEKQLEKLVGGRKILDEHGISTDIFMAPGHSFDENTLKALRESGFRYVTDGYAKEPYVKDDIIFLPVCTSVRRIKALKRRWKSTTVVLHTNYMNEAERNRYGKIIGEAGAVSFDQIKKEMASKDLDDKAIYKEFSRENKINHFYGMLAGVKRKLVAR